MADTKISALSAGTAAPGDEIPVNRGGSNFKITAGDILKINGGTITADSPVLNLTQTWNNAAVTFTGLKFNATDTTSASASLLMDLQVGGTSKFSIDKNGFINANASNSGFAIASTIRVSSSGGTATLWNGGALQWSSTTSPAGSADLILARDAADTLAQRRTTNAQTFRIYNTADGSPGSNYERAKIAWSSNVLQIGTEKGGTGTARALELQTDGTTRLTIEATNGRCTAAIFRATLYFDTPASALGGNGGVYFGAAGANGSQIQSTAAGVIAVGNYAGNDFSRLQFGGTTSSFPALKRSSTTLIARLADDSANAAFESASLKTDAPTGGTAATWKLGTVASVTPTSPDRTIEVDIGGTIYYLHAKTTND